MLLAPRGKSIHISIYAVTSTCALLTSYSLRSFSVTVLHITESRCEPYFTKAPNVHLVIKSPTGNKPILDDCGPFDDIQHIQFNMLALNILLHTSAHIYLINVKIVDELSIYMELSMSQ